MSSYTDLQTDVASWLVAEDVSAQIPTFIRLAEDRHKWGAVVEGPHRRQQQGAIRVRDMERRARANGVDSRYLALPADHLEHRWMQYVGSTQRDRELVYAPSERLATSLKTRPTRYTITRNEIQFNGVATTTMEFEIVYYAPFTPLSAENATNWLLDNAYGAYLFGALCEAVPYLEDDGRMALWEGKYSQIVTALMGSEQRARRSQGMLSVQMGGRSTP